MSSETSAAATILDRFRLDGRVAVVTGASSGLGVHFAEGLAADCTSVAETTVRVLGRASTC